MDEEFDERLRSSALAHLRAVQLRTGGPVRHEDVAGSVLDGERIPLMDIQRGIRKPRMLDAALSFRTVFASSPDQRPYADERAVDGYQRYKWRGRNASHPENVALRKAMERQLPLIWFQGLAPGLYLPVFPVWLRRRRARAAPVRRCPGLRAASHVGRHPRRRRDRASPRLCRPHCQRTSAAARVPSSSAGRLREPLCLLPSTASRAPRRGPHPERLTRRRTSRDERHRNVQDPPRRFRHHADGRPAGLRDRGTPRRSRRGGRPAR